MATNYGSTSDPLNLLSGAYFQTPGQQPATRPQTTQTTRIVNTPVNTNDPASFLSGAYFTPSYLPAEIRNEPRYSLNPAINPPSQPAPLQPAVNLPTNYETPAQTSIPYPTASFSPTSGIDFNQMAFSLGNPQPAMTRNIDFVGPQQGILDDLLAKEAEEKKQAERGLLQRFADPLGLFPGNGNRSTLEQLLNPSGVVSSIFGGLF